MICGAGAAATAAGATALFAGLATAFFAALAGAFFATGLFAATFAGDLETGLRATVFFALLLERLGAFFAGMSGSGSTMFGLFLDTTTAHKAKSAFLTYQCMIAPFT